MAIASALFGGCGGEDQVSSSVPSSPDGSQQVMVVYPPPSIASLAVRFVDPGGKAIPGALITARGAYTGRGGSGTTDADGWVRLDGLDTRVNLTATHPVGFAVASADASATQTLTVTLVAEPHMPLTVALLPAVIPAGSISADRRILDVRLTLVAQRDTFVASSYGDFSRQSLSPLARMGSCMVWSDGSSEPANSACRYPLGPEVQGVSVSWQPVASVPGWDVASLPGSSLLLFEQSGRSALVDPFGLRQSAGRHFLAQVSQAGIRHSGAAAFASGVDAGGTTPAMWAPLRFPVEWTGVVQAQDMFAGTVFDPVGDLSLDTPSAGPAPLLEALQAATRLFADFAPPTGARTLVAIVGGSDQSGLGQPDERAAFERIRLAQAGAGLRTVLVTARMEENSAERVRLGDAAAMLGATVIHAGYPWPEWKRDGLRAAMALAADLASGATVSVLSVVFRVEAPPGETFQADHLLRGTVHVESDICGMVCAELPIEFSARIP
jgi:hypothetical protein